MNRQSMLMALAGLAMAASAQVSVNRHGQIVVGSDGLSLPSFNSQSNSTDAVIIGPGFNPIGRVQTDSLSQICILGKGYNASGGYITFGDKSNVSIGEFALVNNIDYNVLNLFGSGGIIYQTGDGIVFDYSKSGNTFKFYCNVLADGVNVASDSRLKSNVQDLSGTVSSLSGITPVSYNLASPSATPLMAKASENAGEAMPQRIPADDRERFGFIAQEVREVFPQLVSEDEDGYLSVDYIGFIPLLVDAVKELSAKVEEQQEVIASLTAQQPSRKKGTAGIEEAVETVASMSQNNPNPFSQTTVIGVTLPEDVQEAYICIFDLQGKQVMRLPVEERGQTSVRVEGSTLAPGMFIYTLIADGQEVATKRMILTD